MEGERKRGSAGPRDAAEGTAPIHEHSDRFLETIFENVPNMIFIKDAAQLRFVRFNKAGEELLGYPREDLLGKNDYDLFPKEEADFFTEKDREVLRSGKLHDIPAEPIHTRHKGVRWLHTKKIPVWADDGTPLFLLGISEDITEQREAEQARDRAEEQLRRSAAELSGSNQLLAAVLGSAAAGVLTLDGAGRITTMNPHAERLLDISEAEARGQLAQAWLDEATRSAGESNPRDGAVRRRDGSLVPVSLASTPLLQGTSEVGRVLVLFDITERLKIERIKSEFVSSVSHELRTPLTSIRGAIGLLSGGVLGEVPEAAREVLKIAHDNTERLVRLVNDILDLQRMESGKWTFDLRDVDLEHLVEQVVAEHRAWAAESRVSVTKTPYERGPYRGPERPIVRADPERIRQVLSNLIGNAVKFSPQEGTVTVRLSQDDQGLRVEVHDRGQGVPESFRARIFGKFEQADASAARPRGGTGLGLSISKAIVEQHKGTIGFFEPEHGGAVFYFRLPPAPDSPDSALDPASIDVA